MSVARSGRYGPTVPADRPRVLFVEDEASIYEPFSRALAREGFDAVHTRLAAEALEIARRIRPASCSWT